MEVVKPVSRSSFKAQDRTFQHSKEFRKAFEEEPRGGITAHDAWGHLLFTCKTWEVVKARAEAREYNLTKAGVGQYAAYIRCYGKDYAV